MKTTAPKIRIVIDQVRLHGMTGRDARRVVDGLERELARLAPAIAEAAGSVAVSRDLDRVRGDDIRANRRAERNAVPIANAIVKALSP